MQKRLMKQMDGQINDLSDKVSTAEDLVRAEKMSRSVTLDCLG